MEQFDLAAQLQSALVAWRDDYAPHGPAINPHVKSQADCLLRKMAQSGLTVVPTLDVTNGSVVPLVAQYWRTSAVNAKTAEEAFFCMSEAYNNVVGALYSVRK